MGGGSEYKAFIIDHAEFQQDIDTQIDRVADEFQKDESSEASHELEREEYRNTGDGKKYCLVVEIAIAAPFRVRAKLWGGKEERPIINATERRNKGIPLEVELDLSGGISHGKYDKVRSGRRNGSTYYFGWKF